MPADETFTGCYLHAEMTDAEIAEIIRSVAVNGNAGPFEFVDSTADCVLPAGHYGDHAGWVAALQGKPGSAWLRWATDGGGRVDWLADCAKGDCGLYRGHLGECMPELYPEVDDD
jgi:hypothetical protein